MASCGTPSGGCVIHMPLSSPNRRTPPWCCATRPSHSEAASPRPARVPHGRAPGTASGSAPSPPASTPCPAAFFRLTRPPHARLVPLEAGVLQQRGLARVTDALALRHPLVVRLAGVRAAQVAHALATGVDDDHILVAVGLLLAAVVQPL